MRKLLKRMVLVLAVIVVILAVLTISLVDFKALGKKPSGQRLERIEVSPHYQDGRFVNLEPTEVMVNGSAWSSARKFFFGGESRKPEHPLPSVKPDLSAFPASDTSLEVVWLGHSTVLGAIDGIVFITDPVFEASASTFAGLARRFQTAPVPREELPPIDVVIISHDHYDHLEMRSVRFFSDRGVTFFVPLGVGADLEAWGVPEKQIVELDWSESREIGSLEIVCTPARHFSGRSLTDRNQTLWASWTVIGPQHRLFYSGDTGPSAEFARIGEMYGPFDLTLIQIGAYGENWPLIHLRSEEVLEVHRALKGEKLLPVHWGTFDLAFHPWDEPIRSTAAAAAATGVDLVTPRLGEKIKVDQPFESRPWWEE